jgi:hypothetical protein
MLLGTTIVIAAGLNPYVTTLIVAALAGTSSRVQMTGPFVDIDPVTWRVAIVAAALLAAVDLTLGKLRHRFIAMRWVSFVAAVASGAAGAVLGVGSDVDLILAATLGAVGAAATSLAVTHVARHAMAYGAWLRLGHIPAMMAATVVAAVVVPLTITFSWPGTTLAATVALAYTALAVRAWRSENPSPSTG